jgi:thiosulfate/3-mercaptopyruvate sulfurtransferase
LAFREWGIDVIVAMLSFEDPAAPMPQLVRLLQRMVEVRENIIVFLSKSPINVASVRGPRAEAVRVRLLSTPEGIAELKSTFAASFSAAGLSGEETAVVYEQSMNSGFGMSCRGYYILSMLGYPKIKVLHGGFEAWCAAELPVSMEAATPTPATFPIDPSGSTILIDAQAMLDALANPDIAIVDVRDVDEWIADSSSPYGKEFCPRKGRIPGARWLEWYRMMKPTGEGPRFKGKDEILAECATIGVSPDTPVYLYCFKGARASNTYLALKNAGVKDVRMYFGSWNEWSRDPSLPIESGAPFASAA